MFVKEIYNRGNVPKGHGIDNCVKKPFLNYIDSLYKIFSHTIGLMIKNYYIDLIVMVFTIFVSMALVSL